MKFMSYTLNNYQYLLHLIVVGTVHTGHVMWNSVNDWLDSYEKQLGY